MGVSTNGQICYGIMFPEDTEFPWDDHKDALLGWWREVNGFEDTIYDENGEYKSGVAPTKAELEAHWNRQDEFDAAHPLLVDLVNYQSMSYPAIILALKSTIVTARRGYPKQIEKCHTVKFEELMVLQQFCAKYGIEYENEPAWYLSSFWET